MPWEFWNMLKIWNLCASIVDSFLNFRGTNLLHSVFSLLLKSTHSVLLLMTIAYSRIQEGHHHHHHNPHLDLELYLIRAFATTTTRFYFGGGVLISCCFFSFFVWHWCVLAFGHVQGWWCFLVWFHER
jgi:hypothetical protein